MSKATAVMDGWFGKDLHRMVVIFKMKFGLQANKAVHAAQVQQGPDKRVRGGDLIEYLQNGQNYHRFASYLKGCYALENLKFLETIVVFHNALLLSLGRNVHQVYPSQESLQRLFSIPLDHLKQMNDRCVDQVKKGHAIRVLVAIYDEYIASSADQCINISWDVRQDLNEFVKRARNCKSPNAADHDLYRNYLSVFNSAMIEIYRLLNSRYLKDFKYRFNHK